MCNVFYTHDGNKNIAELVFVQQQNGVAAHYNYSPFGVVTVMTNNAPEAVQDFCKCNPFQFSSEYSDKEIALTYYNQRHYDTTNGRWTSSDPAAGEKSYDYIFVSNNPLVAYDYLGLIEPCPKGFPLRYNAGKVQYRSLIDNQKFKKTNGCGAEGGSSFPNSFIYKHIVNFKDCCDAHDVCYGTCSRDKLGCDHNLGSCMRKKCRRLLFMPLAYELCIGQANIYEAAVAIAGSDAFESAQDKCCVWIDCCPEPLSIPSPQFTLSEVINGMNNFIQSP